MTELIKNIIKGAGSISLFPGTDDVDRLCQSLPYPKSTEDAWKEDWSKIGADFQKAMDYVQKEEK